jgi:hypothetical protein
MGGSTQQAPVTSGGQGALGPISLAQLAPATGQSVELRQASATFVRQGSGMADGTPCRILTQSFQYVMPSQPHTGSI